MSELTEQILDKIKIISDRLDSIEKNVSFIMTERAILEDLRSGDVANKELLLNQRDHFENIFKDLRSELKIQGIKTEDKLDQTQEKVEKTHDKIEKVEKSLE